MRLHDMIDGIIYYFRCMADLMMMMFSLLKFYMFLVNNTTYLSHYKFIDSSDGSSDVRAHRCI
jgi:hypothetical protein